MKEIFFNWLSGLGVDVTPMIALVIALGSLEKSIVTTPLPIIGAELNAGAALTWVVTAYLLAATAALPVYGKLSDLFGRVRMLNIGIGLFLAQSTLAELGGTLSLEVSEWRGASVLLRWPHDWAQREPAP